MDINKNDIKTQIIKLPHVTIMETQEFERSLKVLKGSQLLKKLDSQHNRIEFNIKEIDCLVSSLEDAKNKFKMMKNSLGEQIDSIRNTKDYIFIPKDQLKENITFDKINFTSVNEGYLIECDSIPKADKLGLCTNHKIHLTCTENNIKKRLIVSNVHTFDDNDLKSNDHLTDSTKIVSIKSIKM